MSKWKILIADNHPISRAGLKVVLETTPDFAVIGESTSGQQTIKLCHELLPDVILMDISMPNGNGVDATQIIHRQFPHIKIIGISGFRHEEMQQEIIRAGAIGYISKDSSFEEILILIRTLVAGASAASYSTKPQFDLTVSEQKILVMLAEGYERQQIADELGISINTVKMHLRNLYQKLGVSNANDAINIALRHNLIS